MHAKHLPVRTWAALHRTVNFRPSLTPLISGHSPDGGWIRLDRIAIPAQPGEHSRCRRELDAFGNTPRDFVGHLAQPWDGPLQANAATPFLPNHSMIAGRLSSNALHTDAHQASMAASRAGPGGADSTSDAVTSPRWSGSAMGG